jgi:hypothetical protein
MPKQAGMSTRDRNAILLDLKGGEDRFDEVRSSGAVSRISELDTDQQLGRRDSRHRHIVIVLNYVVQLPIPALGGDEDCGV